MKTKGVLAIPQSVKEGPLRDLGGSPQTGHPRACRAASGPAAGPAPVGRSLNASVPLNGPLFEPLIPRVLDDLATLHPSVLVPAHCTGWRAQHAMSARFGSAFIPNSVGTTFHL